MIGLKRGTVNIQPYDPSWPKEFEREKKRLMQLVGKWILDIQYVGSTAIPSMPAKPIIDIAVEVPSLRAAQRYVAALRRIGYKLKQEARTVRLFFTKGPEQRRTHYLHLGSRRSRYVRDMIAFWDYLCSNGKARKEYAELKFKLAEQYKYDRKSYTAAKAKFVQSIITRIKNH